MPGNLGPEPRGWASDRCDGARAGKDEKLSEGRYFNPCRPDAFILGRCARSIRRSPLQIADRREHLARRPQRHPDRMPAEPAPDLMLLRSCIDAYEYEQAQTVAIRLLEQIETTSRS